MSAQQSRQWLARRIGEQQLLSLHAGTARAFKGAKEAVLLPTG